jgi:hypothetical protein
LDVLVEITGSRPSGSVTTTELRLAYGRWEDPGAPATLWTDDDQRVIELHKPVRIDGNTAVFESYDLRYDPPPPGGLYHLIQWWTPEQYETATSTDIGWSLVTWAQPTPTWDHEHCALTWASIEPGDPVYVSDDGDKYLVPDAYEKYVRDDVLRPRDR